MSARELKWRNESRDETLLSGAMKGFSLETTLGSGRVALKTRGGYAVALADSLASSGKNFSKSMYFRIIINF